MKHVNANIDTVSFYNVLGELVIDTSNSRAVDVSKLNTGIYFVAFKIDGKEVIKKVVKE
ncbi:T9SS type A sorting domain-containing protein [Lacinutrix himadriensis]|uniref:T9SS type A sorting domain-containing protein n=1 Tax=Lacinutrix himadriensis TaxID=641549 RepID=UPI0009F94D5A